MRIAKRAATGLGLAALIILWVVTRDTAFGQEQRADGNFDASVDQPAYPTNGPRVLFDEAHKNFHTADGRYKPFADLLKNDGYRITPNHARFNAELLSQYDIIVIANAMARDQETDPAFTNKECEAVREWVQAGGALLLITDHYPMGHAAENLGKQFGLEMSKGMTGEYDFTVENGLDSTHPIVLGRSEAERVRRVRTFTGQSINGPSGSVMLLRLPADAKELHPDPVEPRNREKATEGPAVHPAQGVALKFGNGRVVALGEAGMLTAQVSRGRPFGMNVPDIDNRQFALNIMHWLSGLLPAD